MDLLYYVKLVIPDQSTLVSTEGNCARTQRGGDVYLLNGGEGVLHGLDETTDKEGSASYVAARSRLELSEHGGKIHQIQPFIRGGGGERGTILTVAHINKDTNGGKCVAMWSTPC